MEYYFLTLYQTIAWCMTLLISLGFIGHLFFMAMMAICFDDSGPLANLALPHRLGPFREALHHVATYCSLTYIWFWLMAETHIVRNDVLVLMTALVLITAAGELALRYSWRECYLKDHA